LLLPCWRPFGTFGKFGLTYPAQCHTSVTSREVRRNRMSSTLILRVATGTKMELMFTSLIIFGNARHLTGRALSDSNILICLLYYIFLLSALISWMVIVLTESFIALSLAVSELRSSCFLYSFTRLPILIYTTRSPYCYLRRIRVNICESIAYLSCRAKYGKRLR